MGVTKLLPLLALAAPPAAAQDTVRIVVAATTDIHGRVYHWDYARDREAPWGLTRAATVLDSLREAHPGRVVLVDAGDITQGNPFAAYFATHQPADPHPVIDAMNQLQYDAVAPGNHEFNFGLDIWHRAAAAARFPILAGNAFRLPGGEPAYPATTVIRRDSVRVGIAGFTTPGSMVWDRANLAGRLRVAPILPEAERAITALRDAGVDLRIVTLHSGMDVPSSYDTTGIGPENVAAELARLPVAPHLVVVGHSHRTMTDSVIAGVHFMQADNWVQSLAVAEVWLVRQGGRGAGRQDRERAPGYRIVRIEGRQIPLADVPPSPRITAHVRAAHEAVRGWVAQPLARTEGDWSARYARAQDTPVIDWINAVQARVTGAELSATAAFSTDAGFGAEVRLGDLAGVYPYENTLKAVRISGAALKAYLERSAAYFHRWATGGPVINTEIPGYNYDIVSGVEYAVDLSRPVGSRIRQLTRNGRLVSDTDTFTLALNNYRQGGGGGFAMLTGLPVVYDRGENIRDLLVEAAREAGVLRAADVFRDSWRVIPPDAQRAVRGAFAPAADPSTDRLALRVMSTNDLHGALEAQTPGWANGQTVGGVANLAAWRDTLEARCGCPVVHFDAGDQLQGSPISSWVFGRSTVDALNALDLDAAAIGNHEFDWGMDTLLARLDQAEYPWLAANIRLADGGGTPAWAEPWRLLERGGLSIGVIGLALEGTSGSANPDLVAHLRFERPSDAVRRVLPAVRAAEPDFVVVVAHEGAFCDSVCSGEVIALARELPAGAVDLIVSGHTHQGYTTVVNGIPIVQAHSRGTAFGMVDFVERADGSRLVRSDVRTVWADSVTPDSAVAALVERHAAETRRRAARPVARLRFALERERDGEYALGHLLVDAYQNVARTDFALTNNTGIRANLPGGAVTYGDLFSVIPFGNRLVRLTVSGALLKQILEHALAGDGGPRAHVSGMMVRWDPRRPEGERVREIRTTAGERVRDDRTYTITVPDFLAAGGSRYTMLRDVEREHVAESDIEAVELYLRRLPAPVEVIGGDRFQARR